MGADDAYYTTTDYSAEGREDYVPYWECSPTDSSSDDGVYYSDETKPEAYSYEEECSSNYN